MTGTPDWRRSRWEATHQRIFTCALALFEDFGFVQVSVGQIATRAQVSVPTFYAHYPSKEHLIMAPPTPEQISALIADQPADLAIDERIRRMTAQLIGSMLPDAYEQMAVRWRIIARTPTLRTRAAEFERVTAGMVLEHLPSPSDTAEVVRAGAYFAAYTAALLAWADSGGERKLDELIDEAFQVLDG